MHLEQNPPPLHDVITLGSLFGTAPKPELLDLAVRLAHADAASDNVHVIARAPHSVGPVGGSADAEPSGDNIVHLQRPVPDDHKAVKR